MQLDTAGLLGYWITSQLPRNKCAYADNASSRKEASLLDIHGGFVILCAGVAASILTLVVEKTISLTGVTKWSLKEQHN